MTTVTAQPIEQPEDRWETIKSLWKRHQFLYVLAGLLLGLLAFPLLQLAITDLSKFLGDLAPEAVSTLVAVLVIDRIYRIHANKERLQELITQMRSKDNGLAVAATEILQLKGWLQDGSLQEANLDDANLQGADLMSANLRGADLFAANLEEAFLTGANLEEADLKMTNLQWADLRGANLEGADLRDAKLQGANLWNARLRGADLGYANLQRADLTGANLQRADLTGANLQRADLTGANLQGADLTGANLQRAGLLIANLQGADFDGEMLDLADTELNEQTTLPDGTYWTPDTDMPRFTDPNHPEFWRSDNPRSRAYRGDTPSP